jgi:hypothetical protein
VNQPSGKAIINFSTFLDLVNKQRTKNKEQRTKKRRKTKEQEQRTKMRRKKKKERREGRRKR